MNIPQKTTKELTPQELLIKRVVGLINFIYFVYFATGFTISAQLATVWSDPQNFIEWIGYLALTGFTIIFWLPFKLANLGGM